MARARAFVPPPLPETLATSAPSMSSMSAAAKTLEVRVSKKEGGVSITLPAEAALDLVTLVPEDAQAALKASGGVDLAAVVEKVRQSGIAPQMLFEQSIPAAGDQPAKTYKVWLA